MRKQVSSNFGIQALAAGKTVHFAVYLKKAATLSETHAEGTWIDVTEHVRKGSFPRFSDKTELGIFQFAASSIRLTGLGIAWWDSNFFGYANHLEVRIDFWINSLTADAITVFAGWVDKNREGFRVRRNERRDSVEFTVYSYQEMGNRLSAAELLTQPKRTNINGSGETGVVLQNLPGIYITDANISSFVLKKGTHKISYEYNGGSPRAKLDDGDWLTLRTSDGLDVLENADVDQKIEIYVDASELPTTTNSLSQGLVVRTQGDVLPKVWYHRSWIYEMMRQLYAQLGVSQIAFDDFRIATYDGRHVTSYFEVPIGSSFYGEPRAVAFDWISNALWVGVGDKIFKRSLAFHDYTEIGQVASGYNVVRFLMEDRAGRGNVWGVARDGSGNHKLFKVVVATGALTSYSITRSTSAALEEQNLAFAKNYGTSGGVFYVDSANPRKVRLFDVASATEILSGEILAANTREDLPAWSYGSDYIVQEYAGAADITNKIQVTYTGSWGVNSLESASQLFSQAVWNSYVDLVLAFGNNGVGLFKFDTGNGTNAIDADLPGNNIAYLPTANNLQCSFIATIDGAPHAGRVVSTYGGGADTVFDDGEVTLPFPQDSIFPAHSFVHDSIDGRYLGLFQYSMLLFQHGVHASMFLEVEADFSGKTVNDAIKELAVGFNLLPKVSMTKQAIVKRRADDDGDPVTSGYAVELNADRAKDLSSESGYGEVYDVVSVSNGSSTESYDGTNFEALAFGDERLISLSNRFIATSLLKDFAYRFHKYWSRDHTKFLVPTPPAPLFQFEPIDGAQLSFSGRITSAASGIIIGQTTDRFGRTEFEVVV